jgi:hypothetical protein
MTDLKFCGISAPETLWLANGFSVSFSVTSGSVVTGGPYRAEASLATARFASGYDDWRALAVWAQEQQRRFEESEKINRQEQNTAAVSRQCEMLEQLVVLVANGDK